MNGPARCAVSSVRHTRTCRAPGFSLVEILVALLILGFGLVGLTEGITVALRTSKEAEHQTAAALLATGRLEMLRADKYLSAGETSGEFGGAFPLYGWEERITETTSDGLYRVVIAIKLLQTGETVYELETLLFETPFSTSWGDTVIPDSKKGRSGARERKERP
jgi:prepilin-type N-terminal cleavage/methylation domain-containing protein